MVFRIQEARGTISGQAPGVRADIDVRTGGETLAQAISGMGAAIFDMGQELYAKDAKVKADDAEVIAHLSMVQFLQEIRKEDDVSKWDELFSRHGKRVMTARPKHEGAAARYDSVVKKMVPAWQGRFILQRERKLEDDMLASSITKESKMRKGATFDTMGQTIKDIRAELKLRDKLSFSISRTDTEILLADVARDVQTSAAENIALNNPNDLLARIKGSKIQGFDEITEAGEVVRLERLAQGTQARIKANEKAKYDAYVEETEQEWLVKLRNKELNTNNVMISNLIVDKKQEWLNYLDKQTEEILKGKEIVTNKLIKGEVEAMAYDISTGAVTMPEFNKRLKQERYINKTIDDAAFDEIFSLAQRRFDSYQAQAIKEREIYALGQLVTLPSEEAFAEMMVRLKSKMEREQAQSLRQLQLDNHDRYKKALRDWIKKEENKDATAEDIYKEGRRILVYFRKTPSQLREESAAKKRKIIPVPEISGRKKVGAVTQKPDKPKKESTVEEKKAFIASYPEPKTEVDFNHAISQMPSKEMRMFYFETMVRKIKDDNLAKRIYEKWVDEVYE